MRTMRPRLPVATADPPRQVRTLNTRNPAMPGESMPIAPPAAFFSPAVA